MIPNVAFERLTNEFDLVGYAKLLRLVGGISGTLNDGNKALAAKLNMSYGRVDKLKKTLLKVGFIEIIKGDNAHGLPDVWVILDMFEYQDKPLSPNIQGQEIDTNEDFNALPCHQIYKPLSPNIQATLSPNGQHKEKIVLKGNLKDLSLSARAREEFSQTIKNGLKIRIGVPERLPDDDAWSAAIEFALINEFDEERFLKTYDALERVRKLKRGKWKIKPKLIETNIADLEKLELEIAELETKKPKNPVEPFDPPPIPEADDDVITTDNAIGMKIDEAAAFFDDAGYTMRIKFKNGVNVVGSTDDFDPYRINVAVRDDEIVDVLRLG